MPSLFSQLVTDSANLGFSAKMLTQGDNTLSNLAMHSTHLLMKGVKDTMDFTKDFFNPFQV